MDNKVRVVKENLDTSSWPAYIGTCNRIMTLLTGWSAGEDEEKYTPMGSMRTTFKLSQQPNRCGKSKFSEAWYWQSFHCEWSDLSVTVHCNSLISGRRNVLSYLGPRFDLPGEYLAKWTWDSLVVYMHFAAAMLIRQRCCTLLTAVPYTKGVFPLMGMVKRRWRREAE